MTPAMEQDNKYEIVPQSYKKLQMAFLLILVDLLALISVLSQRLVILQQALSDT